MVAWLLETTRSALNRMRDHAKLVGLANTDEFTFRAFFVASLRERHPSAWIQTEWHRYDLLARVDEQNVLVEFKYYIFRSTCDLDGRPRGRKGGAGAANEREFRACVRKLHECAEPVYARNIVLVYDPQETKPPRKSFETSYGSLCADGFISNVVTVQREPLTCKIICVS